MTHNKEKDQSFKTDTELIQMLEFAKKKLNSVCSEQSNIHEIRG